MVSGMALRSDPAVHGMLASWSTSQLDVGGLVRISTDLYVLGRRFCAALFAWCPI